MPHPNLAQYRAVKIGARLKPRWPLEHAIVVVLTLLLNGCGFHLRGMVDMPKWLNNVAIFVQPAQRELEPLLQSQLQSYKIQVISDPTIANYWLIVENDNFQQNISSISSSTTPRQYQLVYTVRFKLQRADGEEIIPPKSIAISRQITINSNRILGSNDEEESFKIEMKRDAATQIINRISRSSLESPQRHIQHAH
jgi:LPS-assembly lipoprotein